MNAAIQMPGRCSNMGVIHTQTIDSPLGAIILAATDQGLAGVWFEGQRHFPDARGWVTSTAHATLQAAATQLDGWFSGASTPFDLPLDLRRGTTFQQSVWRALLTISSGATTSYGALALTLGNPAAVRAVGAAVGRNPISVIVPCHRVVGATGALTGYAGGVARKAALLAHEQALASGGAGRMERLRPSPIADI